MHIGNVDACFGHYHCVSQTPFGRIAPQARDGKYLFPRKGKPGSGLGSLVAFGFRERADRDQTSPILKGLAPHEVIELVGAGIVNRLWLKGLSILAL